MALELNEESTIESGCEQAAENGHFNDTKVDGPINGLRLLSPSVASRSFQSQRPAEIVGVLISQRVQRDIPKNCSQWHSQIVWLAGQHNTQEQLGTNWNSESADKLKNWISVNRTRGSRDALGTAQASWRFSQ